MVERDRTNLATLCATALAMLRKNPDTPWSTPDGAYFATGPAPGKIGLLFPGQGSQYTGMLRDLACCFPEMLDTLSCRRGRLRKDDRCTPVRPDLSVHRIRG